MNESRLSRMKDAYLRIPVPEELDMAVKSAISRATPNRPGRLLRSVAIAVAAAVCIFTIAVNALPALAASMQDVPILGRIVEVLTFARFTRSGYDLNLDVPEIRGLGDTALQNGLNERYLAQARELYDGFIEKVGKLEEGQLPHRALDAGYKVKVQSGDMLVIQHWKVETGASGVESVRYDTIDLRNEVLLTLPGLFKSDGYVEVISADIKEQMKAQMATNPEVMYFTDPSDPCTFKEIARDHVFYLNEDHKLVIVFDEYAVAPGCMGVVEFVIPTDVIAEQLVGNGYIR